MKFERVLLPVDFSEHSEECMREASRLLFSDEVPEIHLLYVLHTPTDYSDWTGNPTAEVEKHLDEFIERTKPTGADKIEHAVTTGHPSTEITKYAAAHECDLIMMATHGRTGLSHMLLGSTAEQVVRHAPCPVLTIRVRPR
jgi:nucleotide-binding universal stress UspA family protein